MSDATCADHCTFECTSGPNCQVSCGDACTIECASTTTASDGSTLVHGGLLDVRFELSAYGRVATP